MGARTFLPRSFEARTFFPRSLAGTDAVVVPPVHRQIAAKMAELLTADASFSGVSCQQITDPKRELRSMTEGGKLVDCLGVGMRSTTLNRRHFRRDYITHTAIRMKLEDGKVTSDVLDELGRLSEDVQTFFESTARNIVIESGGATLMKAEPFVHASREQLFGDGVFLCPIEYTWTFKPGA